MRERRAEVGQPGSQPGRGVRDLDPHGEAGPLGPPEQATGGSGEVLEDVANGGQVGLAHLGQPQAAGQSLEQLHAEVSLEGPYALADR